MIYVRIHSRLCTIKLHPIEFSPISTVVYVNNNSDVVLCAMYSAIPFRSLSLARIAVDINTLYRQQKSCELQSSIVSTQFYLSFVVASHESITKLILSSFSKPWYLGQICYHIDAFSSSSSLFAKCFFLIPFI